MSSPYIRVSNSEYENLTWLRRPPASAVAAILLLLFLVMLHLAVAAQHIPQKVARQADVLPHLILRQSFKRGDLGGSEAVERRHQVALAPFVGQPVEGMVDPLTRFA